MYSLPNVFRVVKSRRKKWVGHVELIGERRGVYRVLVVETEGKKAPVNPRRRWKDNIKMDVHGGIMDIDYINLAQEGERWRSLVNTTVSFWIP